MRDHGVRDGMVLAPGEIVPSVCDGRRGGDGQDRIGAVFARFGFVFFPIHVQLTQRNVRAASPDYKDFTRPHEAAPITALRMEES